MQIQTEDVNVLVDAISQQSHYDSTNLSIRKIEEFLIYWLNGEEYPNKNEIIQMLYDTFKSRFSYDGILYRGIEMEKEIYQKDGLKTGYLASFSDQKDSAEYFAGQSKMYGDSHKVNTVRIIAETKVINAFALDQFLLAIQEKTSNPDLDTVIEERIWENEKLHLFHLDEIKLSFIRK